MPRIVYVHTEPWVSSSPGVTFITYNAIGLAESGADTHLVVIDNSQGETAAVLQQSFALAAPANLTIHRLPQRRHGAFYRAAVRLIAELADQPITVVTRAPSFLPKLLALRRSKPITVIFETHDYHWSPSLRTDVSLRRIWKKCLYERLYFPRLDGMTCLMETQRALYLRHLPKVPIAVLHTGIHEIVPPPADKREVFAYIGSLDPHKGVHRVLEVARHFGTDSEIVIIGGKTEAEREALLAHAARLGLEGRVRVTGWIDKGPLRAELAKVKWGLVPLDGSFFNAHLTSPLKLFDFYAHGIPVLASDLPTLRELVSEGETGYLVDWQDPQRLAKVLAEGRERYARMVGHVLQAAEGLRWKRRGAELQRFSAALPTRGSRPTA